MRFLVGALVDNFCVSSAKFARGLAVASAVLASFCASQALAITDPPRLQVTGHACQACNGKCACDPALCPCPKLVTFADGTKALFVPGPVDTKGGWPHMGPFRWAGGGLRWATGAKPRVVR